eukprot:TRINITY_DN7230_c0_g1_i4.p1 TRINITY_DN7230_c0_g1~~TRINITY_DN7230_c0_g1_i4.p1  ORF type:complete len:175 (-),score=47.82 TRINITY_DN7230_c0_g1_i4:114-638(-)
MCIRDRYQRRVHGEELKKQFTRKKFSQGKMATRNYLKIGRVCRINYGADYGKHVVVLDVIDSKRALVEGPNDKIPRQSINFNRLTPMRFVAKICRGVHTGILKKAIEKQGIQRDIENSNAYKRTQQTKLRAGLTDFERFRAQVLRFRLAKQARHQARVLSRGGAATKKTAPKKK